MRAAVLAGLLTVLVSHSALADLTVAVPTPSSTPAAPQAIASIPVPPPRPADKVEKPSRTRWYGWQSMTAGGIGATLLFIGGASDIDGGGEGIVAAYVWGSLIYGIAPIGVHLTHKAPLKAVGSGVMLTGLPLTGYAIGMAIGKNECEAGDCRDRSATWGALVGVLAAPVIDGLALGWTKSSSDHARADSSRSGALAFTPVVEPRKGGARVGIAGSF